MSSPEKLRKEGKTKQRQRNSSIKHDKPHLEQESQVQRSGSGPVDPFNFSSFTGSSDREQVNSPPHGLLRQKVGVARVPENPTGQKSTLDVFSVRVVCGELEFTALDCVLLGLEIPLLLVGDGFQDEEEDKADSGVGVERGPAPESGAEADKGREDDGEKESVLLRGNEDDVENVEGGHRDELARRGKGRVSSSEQVDQGRSRSRPFELSPNSALPTKDRKTAILSTNLLHLNPTVVLLSLEQTVRVASLAPKVEGQPETPSSRQDSNEQGPRVGDIGRGWQFEVKETGEGERVGVQGKVPGVDERNQGPLAVD